MMDHTTQSMEFVRKESALGQPGVIDTGSPIRIFADKAERSLIMKEHVVSGRFDPYRLLIVTAVVFAGLAGMTLLANAGRQATINITINNNSQREIRHLYLAAGDPNNCGPDQLNGSTISSG